MANARPNPESLEDLLTNAELYADSFMRKNGKVPPLLFVVGKNDPIMCVADSMTDAESKDAFVTFARLICVAHAATAVVTALEAWVSFAKPGETLDPAESPSESFDRQEVIVLAGETRMKRKQKLLPIIRSDNGNFFGFGEAKISTDKMEGRFSQIISPEAPTAETCAIARAILKAKGFKVQRLKPRDL